MNEYIHKYGLTKVEKCHEYNYVKCFQILLKNYLNHNKYGANIDLVFRIFDKSILLNDIICQDKVDIDSMKNLKDCINIEKTIEALSLVKLN